MQAVILAAGLGNRLKPLTLQTPKCLIEVNGTPILFNSLDLLQSSGVERVVIVTGHLGSLVKSRVGDSWKGMPIVYVDNPDYAKTNNIYSLWLARDYFDRDSVLMECDLYFDKALVERLMSADAENVALVDQFRPYMDGTVVSVDKRGMIDRMILAKDQDETFNYSDKFKTVNIYRFSKKFLSEAFLPSLELYVRTLKRDQYYELILTVLVYMGHDALRAVSMSGVRWMEVDDFSDLQRAEILFLDKKQLYARVNHIHGGYWRYSFQDHAYLYNLHFPPHELFNELSLNQKTLLGQYPSAQKDLVELLSPWAEIPADRLAIGNGASELIALIKKYVVRKIGIPYPTFNEYETGLEPDRIHPIDCMKKDHSIDPDRYVRSVIKGGCNVALLINPNNPTSVFTPPDRVRSILEGLKDLDMFLLDESFIDFVSPDAENSLAGELGRYPNLVILKSLSKNLGTPGLRLGYIASANTKIITEIRRHIPIWNINSMAEYFLEILTKYRAEFRESCRQVMKDRDHFYQCLLSIPELEPVKPSANFVFAGLKEGLLSWDLKKRLFMDAGILIKDCSNKTGLGSGSSVRLAVRTKPESDRFTKALMETIGGMRNGKK